MSSQLNITLCICSALKTQIIMKDTADLTDFNEIRLIRRIFTQNERI